MRIDDSNASLEAGEKGAVVKSQCLGGRAVLLADKQEASAITLDRKGNVVWKSDE